MRNTIFFLFCLVATIVSAQSQRPPSGATADGQLKLPSIDELERVAPGERASQEAAHDTSFVIQTSEHKVSGTTYVILTDHKDPKCIQSLERLAEYRNGIIIRTKDLAELYEDEDEMMRIQKSLRKAKVRYIAIAPRLETYRENMLLGMWELLTTLDDDPQLDAYPGFLLASSEETLSRLVDRSINYRPKSGKELRPFLINQVLSKQELRSLQKSGILQKMFTELGYEAPVVAIYSAKAEGAPKLPGDLSWQVNVQGREPVKKLSIKAAKYVAEASMMILHGHGIPGMSCGLDIDALPEDLNSMVVLCGSCFSAAPKYSDLPTMQKAPGGYSMQTRDAFALRAADNGAIAVFGHMRLNSGFPYLFPVLETWLEGRTVGEAYQELINAIIDKNNTQSGDFIVKLPQETPRRIPQNELLYVIIGDPALQPCEKLKSKNTKHSKGE